MILLVEYEDLPEKIVLSKTRKPKYYTSESRIPKRYSDYTFDEKGRLVDENNNPIIKNKSYLSKPKYLRINFNLFWSGNIHRALRSRIKKELTEFFLSKNINKIESFPIFVSFEHYTSNNSDVDNNSFIYIKSFFDALVKIGIIPDDTKKYITGYSWISKEGISNKLIVSYSNTDTNVEHFTK